MLLKTLILAAILHMSPMSDYPTWAYRFESPDARLIRLDSIAADISTVVSDPEEEPLFDGPKGRIQTAIFLASVMNNESGFRKDVDMGKKFGKLHEACMMQIIPGQKQPMYYSAKYLLSDRKNCIRAGLHMIRMHKCHGRIGDMMRSYVSGTCGRRQDLKVERLIERTAWNEVRGYVGVMNFLDKINVSDSLEDRQFFDYIAVR